MMTGNYRIIFGSGLAVLAIFGGVLAITGGLPWWVGLISYLLITVELLLSGTGFVIEGIHDKTEVPHD